MDCVAATDTEIIGRDPHQGVVQTVADGLVCFIANQ